jgi:hypothetical protein
VVAALAAIAHQKRQQAPYSVPITTSDRWLSAGRERRLR